MNAAKASFFIIFHLCTLIPGLPPLYVVRVPEAHEKLLYLGPSLHSISTPAGKFAETNQHNSETNIQNCRGMKLHDVM